jgi:hypothetical protein
MRRVIIRLSAALTPLTLLALASPVLSTDLALSPAGSALWAGGTAISSTGDLIVTGLPNGLRVHRRSAGDQVNLVGQFDVSGGVRGLILCDSLVYGLDGAGSLFAVSISDPTAPVDRGRFGPDHAWTALAMSGEYLVAAGVDSAISFGLANPALPVPVGVLAYRGPAVSLAAHDSLLLICQEADGMLVGIRHPDGTLTAKGHYGGASVSEIATDGSYAWSPQGDSGILVIDLTDPSSPHALTRIFTYGHAEHVALAGDRLLVADSRIGLISYRLITRPLPVWQSESNGLVGVTKLQAESPGRFWAIQAGEFMSVDVDVLGRLSLGTHFGHRGGFGPILRYRDWIYITDSTGIWRMDGSAPLADSAALHLSSRGVFGAALSQDKLIAAEGHSGAGIYHINEEGYLEILSRIPAEEFSGGIVVGRDTLMVLDALYGFRIYDFANPRAPRFLGGRPIDRQPPVGAIFRKYLYLSEPQSGVSVWNWEHYAKPEMIRFLDHTHSTEAMLIDDDRLYVADRDSGLSIFSLADPSDPALLGRMSPPFSPTALHLSGRVLYVGESAGRIVALDVEDPASLTILAQVDLPGSVIGITKYGERLFVATQWAAHTVGISPPLVPGDFNDDGVTDTFDLVAMIEYFFRGGPPPSRLNAADVNGDGRFSLVDIVRMIDYLFSGGPDLVPGQVE